MALVLAPEPPLTEWLAALDAQIARSPSFFEGRPVLVDLGALPREQPNVAGLIESLVERGIRIIGTEGAHPTWAGVEKWGRPLNGSRPGKPIDLPESALTATSPAASAAVTSAPPDLASASAGSGPAGSDPTGADSGASSEPSSLMLEHSIRSGQSVVFDKGDVTIMGSVASGAEVMAGGSIHIYGTLRGRAVAGVTGNPRARIFCRRLEAELLAIDGLYRTADDVEPALRGRAVQAWLDGATLRIAALD
jgi:septum site-determining protein MinC